MPRWIVKCKQEDCLKEFPYKEIDPLHPRQTVNSGAPNKPPLPPRGLPLTCPYCTMSSQYYSSDLRYHTGE